MQLLLRLLPSSHDDVVAAREDTEKTKELIDGFNAQRTMCLIIFGVLFSAYIQKDQLAYTAFIAGVILFTVQISLIFSGVSPRVFETQVQSLGSIIYTLANISPGIILLGMLGYEVARLSTSKLQGFLIISFWVGPLLSYHTWSVYVSNGRPKLFSILLRKIFGRSSPSPLSKDSSPADVDHFDLQLSPPTEGELPGLADTKPAAFLFGLWKILCRLNPWLRDSPSSTEALSDLRLGTV